MDRRDESAKFWLGILNSLKNRGVEDILIACVDELTGFTNAIEAVYPRTEVQQCIIHQIRNTTRFVSYKDIKELMKDLKLVYGAVDEPSTPTRSGKKEGKCHMDKKKYLIIPLMCILLFCTACGANDMPPDSSLRSPIPMTVCLYLNTEP